MENFKCEVDTSVLRADTGLMKTASLFLEKKTAVGTRQGWHDYKPVYTLKDFPYKGYPSMYQVYMDSATEYEAAIRLLGSWKHWKKLSKVGWFKKGYLDDWQEERKLREEALAKTTILESTADGNVSAAKSILDEQKRRGAGRPNNDEIVGHLRATEDTHNHLSSIVDRMKSVK